MDYLPGKLSIILIAAVLLACAGAWWLAARYRASMQQLMSAPVRGVAARPAPRGAAPPPEPCAEAPAWTTPVDNRRAGWHLTALLVGLSCLMALSSASLLLAVGIDGGALFSAKRAAVIALVHLWPVIPVLGLLWRWSPHEVLAALALWCLLCFGVMLWRSVEPRPMEVLLQLVFSIGPSLALLALLCMGNVTRAVAPWLLLPMIALVSAAVFSIEMFGRIAQHASPWQWALPLWLRGWPEMLLFALLATVVTGWLVRSLGRVMGRAYAHKSLSEMMALFIAVWSISLLSLAIDSATESGLGGLMMLVPLAWIPLAMALNQRLLRARDRGRPPTLLVLRVFQHDARVQLLFDHVVERWRLTGNTLLIAGTDLLTRTLDAEDIFTFLEGGLPKRFIASEADVAPRLAAFDLAADADGRYRVNECYCHDSTWQRALEALVQRSDVVLMDLRSFQTRNGGCLFELGTLARANGPRRVVVLTDGQTDRGTAEAAAAGAPAGRFVWLDTARVDARKRHEVLHALFVAAPVAAPMN